MVGCQRVCLLFCHDWVPVCGVEDLLLCVAMVLLRCKRQPSSPAPAISQTFLPACALHHFSFFPPTTDSPTPLPRSANTVQLLKEGEELQGAAAKPKRPRALVLGPTRELTDQILQVAKVCADCV